MPMFGRTLLALLPAALLPLAGAAEEIKCPPMPEPEARLEWVAPYMIFNGVPMSVKRFDSERRPSEILDFYRRKWAAGPGGPAAVEYTTEPWQNIAVARGKCFYTVQVQAAGRGSTGLLSVTEALDKPIVVDSEKVLPMMTGTRVVNDIEHRDQGKNARTLLMLNSFSPETNADFYRRMLEDQGWRPVSGYQMNMSGGTGITLVMKRGLAEASLVITRRGRDTAILANLVDLP